MSSFSGLSALLTVSIVALVTMQMLKDNFNVVEGYDNTPYTVQDMTNYDKPNSMVNNKQENIHNTNLHDTAPFVEGTIFSGPKIYDGANKFNATPDTYRLYQAEVAAATPTKNQLINAGNSENITLPGPNDFMNNDYVQVTPQKMGRAGNLSLCSQNFSLGTSPVTVSAGLLPDPKYQDDTFSESFTNCDVTNVLSNQVFLTKQNGLNMSSGSLRNSNYDIRSAPPNPMQSVGPWLNSTIYPDLTRRPLEGCGPSFGLYGSGSDMQMHPRLHK